MLLDSNIIIYSALPEYERLREFIRNNSPFVSNISRVEVLGFQKLSAEDIEYFETFFESTTIIPVSEEVIVKAILLRQQRKMSLGDSLIAASAITNGFSLVTNNTRDYKWIDNLTLIDPLKD